MRYVGDAFLSCARFTNSSPISITVPVEIFGKIKNQYGKPHVGASGEDGILQRRGGYFYDLGCGTGKPLVAAALLHEFDICCGIECLEGLFTAAVELVGIYNVKVRYNI